MSRQEAGATPLTAAEAIAEGGLTTRALARKLRDAEGGTLERWRRALNRWNAGTTSPNEKNAAALERALGLPTGAVRTVRRQSRRERAVEMADLHALVLELLRRVDALENPPRDTEADGQNS